MYTPIFLDMNGQKVLVIGGGPIGARKAAELAKGGALITLLAPEKSEADWRDIPHTWLRQAFDPATPPDIDGFRLIVAAAGDPAINSAAARLAATKNVLCNSASAPAEGSAILPGVARGGGFTAAIASDGQAPFLTKRIKNEIAALLANYDADTVARLAAVRQQIIKRCANDAAAKKRLLDKLAAAPAAAFNAIWQEQKGNCDEIIDRLQREQAGPDPD